MKPHRTILNAFSLVSIFYVNIAVADQFISQDHSIVITTTPITSISSASVNSGLITSTFPGWSVIDGGTGSGSVVVTPSQYYAVGTTSGGMDVSGGASISATYSNPAGIGWIQIVTSNDPLKAPAPCLGSPCVDVAPGATTPFAYLPSNNFHDYSNRNYSDLTSSAISWSANLYPATAAATGTTGTVYNGINWGWQMNIALTGNSSGTFLNPSPGCPPAACSGVGTSSFSWGTPMPDVSSLTFQPYAFNPLPGEVFALGKLTFHNGTIVDGSEVNAINLDIGINLTYLPGKSTTLHTSLALVNTPNTSDPIASADYINFTSGGFGNSFNVFEGTTASADLLAVIDSFSTIHPQGSSTTANLFVGELPEKPSPETFDSISYDGRIVGFRNDGGFQETTPGDPTTIVPQPRTAYLLVSSLLVLVYLRRKSRTRSVSFPVK
jgi:hypothetical protein